MNLPLLSDPPNRGQYIKLRPAVAKKSVEDAQLAFLNGNLEESERLVVSAVVNCPNSFVGYQLLGDILSQQGKVEDADHAYLGELPNSLAKCYLSESSMGGSTGVVSSRDIVHLSDRYQLPEPRRLSGSSWGYSNSQIVSNETWVDTLENGSAWDDGHNTVVFDSLGDLINDHTMGGTAIVRELIQRHSPQYAGERVFLLSARGGGNFYHWMTDILPKFAILQDAGYSFRKTDRFVVPMCNKAFQMESLTACGISLEQIYATSEESPYFCSDELVVPRLKNVMGLHMGRWLPQFLQDTMLVGSDLKVPSERELATGEDRIFISRDPTASNGRAIENIGALNEIFEGIGFKIVYPERLSTIAQARCFHDASIIFAPHGAGLTNIVFCKPDTKIVEFYGAHIAPCYWAISAIQGLQYYSENCLTEAQIDSRGKDAASTLSARRSAGFSVDIQRLRTLLALVGVD